MEQGGITMGDFNIFDMNFNPLSSNIDELIEFFTEAGFTYKQANALLALSLSLLRIDKNEEK